MRKILLTFLTVLLCSIGAWADDTYYLQSTTSAGTLDTKNFYTTAPCTQSVSVSYDDVDYTKAEKFAGNVTSVTGNNYPDRMIRYDCKTTNTDFIIVAYANSASKIMYVGDVKENATLGSANTVSSTTNVTLNNGSITTKTYNIASTTPASLYVSVGANSNAFVVQIIAIEKGTRHPKPGEIGYQANFNKARLVARSGGTTWLDTTTFTFIPNQNQTAGSSTYYKGQTKGTHYIKFHTGAYPTKTTVNVSSSATYYIGTSSAATTNSSTSSQSVILNANTDYYINPNGSNIQVTGIKFEAAPYSVTHTLTNITKTSGSTGTGAALSGSDYSAVFGGAAGYTLPSTITVTIGGNAATVGTDYTWNSSTGAFTVPAAKVTGDIVVTIVGVSGGGGCSAPTSPSITGTTAYTAGNNISLSASATGTSGTTTYTWYKGADWATASASSPVQAASTSGATFTKASCSMSDAGTYWCNISNGTGCDVQVSQAITVACKNPTQTFSNSDYTIGGAALNLSTKFSSNSSEAVTYSVQNAGGTGASIAGTSFTATTEGTATVRASQAANGDYCAKTIDASVSVAADDCTDPGLTITLN